MGSPRLRTSSSQGPRGGSAGEWNEEGERRWTGRGWLRGSVGQPAEEVHELAGVAEGLSVAEEDEAGLQLGEALR